MCCTAQTFPSPETELKHTDAQSKNELYKAMDECLPHSHTDKLLDFTLKLYLHRLLFDAQG